MPGFQAAIDHGLDGVEWDVRPLGDGTLVLHHDPQLTDGRWLRELEQTALPKYVPTLEAGLAWAVETGAYVNVELKAECGRPGPWVLQTLDAIRVHGLTGQVIVSSFSPLILRTSLEHAPSIERGLLIHQASRLGLRLPALMRAVDATALHPQSKLVSRSLINAAHAQGWRINTWTVNDAAEVQRLVALGIDGLIGDVPDVLLIARCP